VGHFMYFGYGSNLLESELQRSCSTATFKGIARLPSRELAFTVYSGGREGGVADIRPHARAVTWGALWAIDERQLVDLDQRESFQPGRPKAQNLYNRFETDVYSPTLGKVRAYVYEVESTRRQPYVQPSAHYLGLIHSGALAIGLPAHYRRMLVTKFGHPAPATIPAL